MCAVSGEPISNVTADCSVRTCAYHGGHVCKLTCTLYKASGKKWRRIWWTRFV